jgi:hypothetical protein
MITSFSRPIIAGATTWATPTSVLSANDAGDGPSRDVTAAIEAVKKLGFVDESKIAVSGASVTDLNEEYNLSDGNVSGRSYFKGSPWTGKMKDCIAQSPIATPRK